MSANPSPPPTIDFPAFIGPALTLLMVGAIWAAILIPLLVLLFYLSSPAIRKQPIFLMNVFSVTLGIVLGIMNIRNLAPIIINPLKPVSMKMLLAYFYIELFLPIFMDCILAVRLYAVYPPRYTSKQLLGVIFIPVVLFKIARTTNIIIFMVKIAQDLLDLDAATATISFQTFWDHAPWAKVEWFLQVLDNCYTSAFFLWRLWSSRRREQEWGTNGIAQKSPRGSRIQRLIYLALSSFLFPCLFSIAQVIVAFHNNDFYISAEIFISNVYVEIICVLLATIWAEKTKYEIENDKSNGTQLPPMSFKISAVNSEVSVAISTTNRDNVDVRDASSQQEKGELAHSSSLRSPKKSREEAGSSKEPWLQEV